MTWTECTATEGQRERERDQRVTKSRETQKGAKEIMVYGSKEITNTMTLWSLVQLGWHRQAYESTVIVAASRRARRGRSMPDDCEGVDWKTRLQGVSQELAASMQPATVDLSRCGADGQGH